MRYYIRRTSIYDDHTPPCDHATKVSVTRWDQRTFKTPEEHDANLPRYGRKPWLSEGSEHGVNEIGIYRRFNNADVKWIIEAASLEDLVRQFREVVVVRLPDRERHDGIEFELVRLPG